MNAALALDARIPAGALESKWDAFKAGARLVNPANAGATASSSSAPGSRAPRPRRRWPSSATTSTCFCFQDSPRRAHSIAAQGGINAAKNYQNDGDSVCRLFYDTVKGGDFRSREANVYRLAQLSRQHHRPVRRAGRAVRARVRRHARQPLVRRRAGRRARSTRAARPASSCCSAPTRRCERQIGAGQACTHATRAPRCSTWSSSTAARAASSRATW